MDQRSILPTHGMQVPAFADPVFFGMAAPAIPNTRLSTGTRFASAGTSFARHLGQALRQEGLTYVDVEPAPSFMSDEEAESFGYGVYSARYGDIHTSRQLLQTIKRAFLDEAPESGIWRTPQGRWVDAFRPEIEKNGFGSREEVLAIRHTHLAAVRKLFLETDVLAFTLGNTQTWESVSDGFVYPLSPGAISDEFDPEQYRPLTLTVSDMLADFDEFFQLTRNFNPDLQVVLSVAPFPSDAPDSDEAGGMRALAALQAAAESISEKHAMVEFLQLPAFDASLERQEKPAEPDLLAADQQPAARVLSDVFGTRVRHPAAQALASGRSEAAIDPKSGASNDFLCDDFIIAQLGYSGG